MTEHQTNNSLPVKMHSALKWRSQIKILFFSIRILRSGVISLVRETKRNHSSRAFCFNSFVCSPSESDTVRNLNRDSWCFALVWQLKNAQLPPPIYLQRLFTIDFEILAQVKQEKYNSYTVIRVFGVYNSILTHQWSRLLVTRPK